jgi:hypothetical protein
VRLKSVRQKCERPVVTPAFRVAMRLAKEQIRDKANQPPRAQFYPEHG